MIHTEGLCLQYKNKLALDHLDLHIPAGGIHAIVGANGAGKSSLFRVLLGLEAPSAGRARILGHDCSFLPTALRARIGFVNDEHSMPPWMRTREVVAMQQRHYPRWNHERLQEVIRHFNVAPEQYVRELSRGERAGLNLALAMAQSPELLILDEPTLGLDVVAKRAFLEALLFTSGDAGMSIIYCSHIIEEVERVADQLIILERGRLRHQAAPELLCAQVRLWIADFGGAKPALDGLPGVLQVLQIEGISHILCFGQDQQFGARLLQLGAIRVQDSAVGLEHAVNGLLSQYHTNNERFALAA